MVVGHAGVLGASVPRHAVTDFNIVEGTAITQPQDMEGSLVLDQALKPEVVLRNDNVQLTVDGQVGILGASVLRPVETDISSATDTATALLQNMEGSNVLDQTKKHDRVPSNHAQ